ncbi:ubiquitin-conjugating enzyme E2-22 kDa [Drosophila mojavensis]|uniref:E2 ubiquitin-conjugating enzyme n=1 Tax=Drosophila mojavensis TaxID=7230 RepID=A0A0Q9WUU1_DROMO|nr:ubiquitin-conjugating enzyme E2-22 kDa [Drosophila mojavensis]KRF93996.1 uncharacterized protein Dmoj_GI27067 [Drosophila mojavensis]
MTSMAEARVKREFKEALSGEEFRQCHIKMELVNDNWTELRGEIAGPRGTPYEGGRFVLEIKVPEGYPFSPPEVRFITPIWHPNVSSVTGAIRMDILKDHWAAAMTLRTVLLSLQGMLSVAEPDDWQDFVVALQFKQRQDIFLLTAKHWTSAYAGGTRSFPELDLKIQRLNDMGIDEHKARAVLSKENWDLERAADCLFL